MTSIPQTPSRVKTVGIWVLRVLLGLAFLFFSFMKLSGKPNMVAEFEVVGLGQWFRYFTGTLELFGGLAVLVPQVSVFGAILLLLVDCGAFVAQVTILHMDWIHTVVIAALIGLLIYLQHSLLRVFIDRIIGKPSNVRHITGKATTMTSKPRIGLVIGSTRPTRLADKPAQWMLSQAQARGDIDVEIVDLRDHPLPFFDEMASNLWMPSQNPEAIRWQETIGRFDGFIFVVAEYNHSITGALKNALDQAYKEWNRKPFTAIAYGGVGGARAVEHLRAIGTELQMVSTRSAVHIGGGDFMALLPRFGNKSMEDIQASLLPSAAAALDELVWWTKATMAAKATA